MKYMKIFFKIKTLLDVYVPEDFKRMQTGLGNVTRKLKK